MHFLLLALVCVSFVLMQRFIGFFNSLCVHIAFLATTFFGLHSGAMSIVLLLVLNVGAFLLRKRPEKTATETPKPKDEKSEPQKQDA